jgi:GTP-binding protein
MVLEVPPGTVVYERLDDELIQIADLTTVGQRVLVAQGGRGGRGNAAFATSTNRAPRRTEPGTAGDHRVLHLRLKLLADVGLVGYPNAGKSTLIARISAARPKIADYPFTTLTPNLGVVQLSDERSFVVADVPGLIEGAHEGHGLGTKFLAHLERTKGLVHVIDVSSASGRDPVDDFEVISRELALFAGSGDTVAGSLQQKPQIVAANKIDALDDPDRLERLRQHLAGRGVPVYAVSGVTGEGVPALVEAMWTVVASETAARAGSG